MFSTMWYLLDKSSYRPVCAYTAPCVEPFVLSLFLFLQEYFSLSVEDAVHQPMTAHLEASAVAGIASGGTEREPLQPTILTSPYGNMGNAHRMLYIVLL